MVGRGSLKAPWTASGVVLERELSDAPLRVVAQFVVAGRLIRVLDAWIADLDMPWQLTMLALAQFAVAFAHDYLENHEVLPVMRRPPTRSGHEQTQVLRGDREAWTAHTGGRNRKVPTISLIPNAATPS